MLICLSYFININQSPYVNNISVCITAMKHEGKKKKKKKRHLHSRNSRTSRFTNFTSAILNRYWFLLKHFVYTHFYYICWNLCIILHNERETRLIQNTEQKEIIYTFSLFYFESAARDNPGHDSFLPHITVLKVWSGTFLYLSQLRCVCSTIDIFVLT